MSSAWIISARPLPTIRRNSCLRYQKVEIGRSSNRSWHRAYPQAVWPVGVDANDKPTHNEWTGKFDGKDYPVIGDPNSDVRSYTKIGDRAFGV